MKESGGEIDNSSNLISLVFYVSFRCDLKLPNNNKIMSARLKMKINEKPGEEGDARYSRDSGVLPGS